MTNLTELRSRVSHVVSSRRLLSDGLIKDHMAIPTNVAEEKKIVQDTVFEAIKNTFIGCRINPNKNAFSVKLDGAINVKAQELYDYIQEHPHWKSFLESQHSSKLRTILNLQNVYQERRELKFKREDDGRRFIYVPFEPHDIPSYHDQGLYHMLQYLKQSFDREKAASVIFDEVMQLIETERQRRIEERNRLMQRIEAKYKEDIKASLLKPIGTIRGDVREKLIQERMVKWCNEQGLAPAIPQELTYQNIIPVGTEVSVVVKSGSQEEGWFAVPRSGGFEIPEGFERLMVYDNVTRHDALHQRSRSGSAPIVINEDTFTEFDINYWKHLLPEEHAQYKAGYEAVVASVTAAEVKIVQDLLDEQKREEEARIERQKQELEQKREELRRQREREDEELRRLEATYERENEQKRQERKRRSLDGITRQLQEQAETHTVEDDVLDIVESDYTILYNPFGVESKFTLVHASGEEENFASEDDLKVRIFDELDLDEHEAVVYHKINQSRIYKQLTK
ncbi:hypothetical protein_gp213 [Bacillus phage vB_BceM_WH1]|nr:hypothetical protein_gp213 [Bacillus phage vB_BceM_WH1]